MSLVQKFPSLNSPNREGFCTGFKCKSNFGIDKVESFNNLIILRYLPAIHERSAGRYLLIVTQLTPVICVTSKDLL